MVSGRLANARKQGGSLSWWLLWTWLTRGGPASLSQNSNALRRMGGSPNVRVTIFHLLGTADKAPGSGRDRGGSSCSTAAWNDPTIWVAIHREL